MAKQHEPQQRLLALAAAHCPTTPPSPTRRREWRPKPQVMEQVTPLKHQQVWESTRQLAALSPFHPDPTTEQVEEMAMDRSSSSDQQNAKWCIRGKRDDDDDDDDDEEEEEEEAQAQQQEEELEPQDDEDGFQCQFEEEEEEDEEQAALRAFLMNGSEEIAVKTRNMGLMLRQTAPLQLQQPVVAPVRKTWRTSLINMFWGTRRSRHQPPRVLEEQPLAQLKQHQQPASFVATTSVRFQKASSFAGNTSSRPTSCSPPVPIPCRRADGRHDYDGSSQKKTRANSEPLVVFYPEVSHHHRQSHHHLHHQHHRHHASSLRRQPPPPLVSWLDQSQSLADENWNFKLSFEARESFESQSQHHATENQSYHDSHSHSSCNHPQVDVSIASHSDRIDSKLSSSSLKHTDPAAMVSSRGSTDEEAIFEFDDL